MNEIKAFFELDTERYKIHRRNHNGLNKDQPEKAWRLAESTGIEKLLHGRNQYRERGFHTLMVQKMDQARDRTEAQRLHQQLRNMASGRSLQHHKSMGSSGRGSAGGF